MIPSNKLISTTRIAWGLNVVVIKCTDSRPTTFFEVYLNLGNIIPYSPVIRHISQIISTVVAATNIHY